MHTIDDVVDYLNELLKLDRPAIAALIAKYPRRIVTEDDLAAPTHTQDNRQSKPL